MMSSLQALLIGMLQGLTEFLPVSSSAHLKLAKLWMGVEESEAQVLFDLVCHLGTLAAILLFLKTDIQDLLKTQRKQLLLLSIALFPLVPFYILLKPLREFASQTHFVGFFLILTAIFLFAAERVRFRKELMRSFKTDLKDALWIGTLQSAALIPGISRSASTISCALTLGWDAKRAVRFSFLLSIPTIIGGNALQLLKLYFSSAPIQTLSSRACLCGFLAAFGVGMLVIRHAMRWLESGKLKPFAWYCLILGIATSIFLNL